ncbi:hypothetical protein ID866_8404 [Astraeus odoratus]|nr:hypothetical protein ID866_8404 [Astraeus odoratus]
MSVAAASTSEVLSSAQNLLSTHAMLISRVRQAQRSHRRQLRSLSSPPTDLLNLPLIPSPSPSPPPSPPSSPLPEPPPKPQRPDLPPAKRARLARYSNYVPEEETIRNDYSLRYVDGGEWPQNWVLGAEPERRFEEYPKQQRLLNLKKESVDNNAVPPSYLPFPQLSSLQSHKFDIILLDPPFSSSFGWDELQELPIPSLAADPSFIFMWVGSGAGEGLERGREVLAKWNYRRCEDVVWVKTNMDSNRGPGTDPPTTSLFTRTKQHCLMGIKGTVRRSTDSWFVHCNASIVFAIDTDVIIWEGDPDDPTRKPPEMYTLIENFCLGTRRLEVFGRARSSLRRGWVTVLAEGEEERVHDLVRENASCIPDNVRRWEKDSWEESVKQLATIGAGKCVVPNTPEIESLRPKSPMRTGAMPGGGGVSGGVGVGVSGGVPLSVPGAARNGRPSNASNPAPNQMMVPPMMNVGMGTMPMGVGMPVEMSGWPGMGMNMNMAGMGMGIGNMNMPMMGMNGMNVDGMAGAPMWVSPEAAAESGMWEGGMGDGMMMNGMGMGMGTGMGTMGMGMGNVGMGGMMGPLNGMGMNQWNHGPYEGFQ